MPVYEFHTGGGKTEYHSACGITAYPFSGLRELLRDPQGAKEDRSIAQRKIAEYRSRLNDSTYSIYADTTQRFDRLLSFDSKFAGGSFDRITGHNGGHEEMRLLLREINVRPAKSR